MKRILCVAILMGLTTALHAVTYTWDSDSSSFKDNSGNKLQAYKDISKLVISVEYKGTAEVIWHGYFAFKQKGSDGSTTTLLSMEVASSNKAFHSIEGTYYEGEGHWSAARAGEGKPITSTYNFGDATDGVFTTFNVSHVFYDQAQYDPNSGNYTGTFDFNGKSFDTLEVMSPGVEIVSASIEIDGTPVPEPGLLALLALGGAGLVLRRRKVRV